MNLRELDATKIERRIQEIKKEMYELQLELNELLDEKMAIEYFEGEEEWIV